MKKQLTVFFLVLSVILNIMLGAYIFSNQGLSDDDIKKKFDCDRVTLEIRETDIFCSNPDLYRQAVE